MNVQDNPVIGNQSSRVNLPFYRNNPDIISREGVRVTNPEERPDWYLALLANNPPLIPATYRVVLPDNPPSWDFVSLANAPNITWEVVEAVGHSVREDGVVNYSAVNNHLNNSENSRRLTQNL